MTSIEPKPETAKTSRRANAEARQRMQKRQATIGYALTQRCRKKVEECFGQPHRSSRRKEKETFMLAK